jgi:hypothetical protein
MIKGPICPLLAVVLARQRLTHMRDFYAFLLDEIPACWTAGISSRGALPDRLVSMRSGDACSATR